MMRARGERMPCASEGHLKLIAMGSGKRNSQKISKRVGLWAVGECSEG